MRFGAHRTCGANQKWGGGEGKLFSVHYRAHTSRARDTHSRWVQFAGAHGGWALCEACGCLLTRKYRKLCCHAAALCGHYRGPHTRVAHRAVVCARSARPRMPTSTATTPSDVRQPAAAQERAHGRCSTGWHKKAHRTPPRAAMAFRARWIPNFSTHLQPPSLRLITT